MEHLIQRLFKNNPFFIFFFLTILTFVLYFNTLQGEFCSDDFNVIVENPFIKDLGNFTALKAAFKTRILPGLTFALNYHFGGLHVLGYHIFNILVHATVSFLVYCFASVVFSQYYNENEKSKLPYVLALFSSLIFLSHPLATESTAYITQRFTSLVALFYMGSLLLYSQYLKKGKGLLYYASLLSMLLGCITKESIMSLPLVLMLYEIIFNNCRWKNIHQAVYRVAPFAWLSVCIPMIWKIDRTNTVFGLSNQVNIRNFSWDYVFTEMNIFLTNLRLMFAPINLNHSYDYPIVSGPFEGLTLVSLLVMILFVFLAIKLFSHKRIFSFCILWFFITTSVEATAVVFGIRGILYEHWLYLATVGFALFIPALCMEVMNNRKHMSIVLTGIIIVFSIFTVGRNQVWRKCDTLWLDVLSKSPNDHIALINLGVYYSREGQLDMAIDYFDQALQLDRGLDGFRLSQLYSNIAAAYGRKGHYEKEIEYSQKAITFYSDNELAYNNLAVAYAALGRYQIALPYAKKAIELYPGYADGYNNLGMIYGRMGKYLEARRAFEKALTWNPTNSSAQKNLQEVKRRISLLRKP